jgi:uncharacterized membrane protein
MAVGSGLATGQCADLEARTINIFYIGDCFAYSATPYNHLKEEPPFRMTAIPTWDLDLMRSMRHYMPRTYRDHLEKNDVVLMSDAIRSLFRPEMLEWFGRGVIEGGQGLLMVGGWGSFGARVDHPSWRGSAIEDVLPVLCVDQAAYESGGSVCPVPVGPDHEFNRPLPWEGAPPFSGFNTVQTKQGATELLLPEVTMGTSEGPLLVFWEVGEGASIANTPDLTYGWVSSFGDWEYYGDYCVNLIYLLARLGVPQDTHLVHAARAAMFNFAQEKLLLLSLAEFVDRFGADSRPIEEGIDEIGAMKTQADLLYMDQDFLGALNLLKEVAEKVRDLGGVAMTLKDRALMWVYIAEWLVVSATMMITGNVVWSLMIRRKLYRNVHATRLQG